MPAKRNRWLLGSLITGGIGILLLTAFWVALLFNNHPAFVPNYEKRREMFKALARQRRQGGGWTPQQGENWIF